ncbi:hypothetical protein H0X48_04130 [Candidatus Dependentiae bacterium]|nr:hypothetical protein [Candidatus Dependentiae bacterium]
MQKWLDSLLLVFSLPISKGMNRGTAVGIDVRSLQHLRLLRPERPTAEVNSNSLIQAKKLQLSLGTLQLQAIFPSADGLTITKKISEEGAGPFARDVQGTSILDLAKKWNQPLANILMPYREAHTKPSRETLDKEVKLGFPNLVEMLLSPIPTHSANKQQSVRLSN